MTTTTLQDANDVLRSAVTKRLKATAEESSDVQSFAEPRRFYGHTETPETKSDTYAEWQPAFQGELPAERLLLDALAVIRDRRPKYGGPLQHFRRTVGMINAAFADVLKRPLTEADWAIFMTLDKVARYCGPNKTADGPVDLAGYAACLAEVESAR